MVRAGRVADAIAEAHASTVNPSISLQAIASEQARMGEAKQALATAGIVVDSDARAGALVAIADECRRTGDLSAADSALALAMVAAKKIRGDGWRHWRVRCLAKIGLVRFRLGQADAAWKVCRLALDVAEEQKGEARHQSLGDVIVALCLVGDLDTAALVIQRIDPDGARLHAVRCLAAAHIVAGPDGPGLALLDNTGTAVRFGTFLSAGRMLARGTCSDRAQEFGRRYCEIDQLGLLVGYGSALQDLGRFVEAGRTQQAALQLAQKLASNGPLPCKEAQPGRIAKDLALNVARGREHERALDIAILIDETSEQRRIIQAICVCAAEVGDMEAVRRTLKKLERPEDRATAMAYSAAALVAFSDQAERPVPSKRRLELLRAASELISESFHSARAIASTSNRDCVLWQIVPAALLARSSEVAYVAGMLIKAPEARQQASDALLGWPPEECESPSS